MRYLAIFRTNDVEAIESGRPPSTAEVERMAKLIDEMARKGVLQLTDGLKGTATGARVSRGNGRSHITDGPFTEAKELVAGYAILNVDSREEAIMWAERFLDAGGDGECEVREMWDQPAYDASDGVNRAMEGISS